MNSSLISSLVPSNSLLTWKQVTNASVVPNTFLHLLKRLLLPPTAWSDSRPRSSRVWMRKALPSLLETFPADNPILTCFVVSQTESAQAKWHAKYKCTAYRIRTWIPVRWNCRRFWKSLTLVFVVWYWINCELTNETKWGRENECSFLLSIRSHADKKCSGTSACELDVMILIKHSKPCPLELSSYLEASYSCVSGNETLFLSEVLQIGNAPEGCRARLRFMSCSSRPRLVR